MCVLDRSQTVYYYNIIILSMVPTYIKLRTRTIGLIKWLKIQIPILQYFFKYICIYLRRSRWPVLQRFPQFVHQIFLPLLMVCLPKFFQSATIPPNKDSVLTDTSSSRGYLQKMFLNMHRIKLFINIIYYSNVLCYKYPLIYYYYI